MNTLTVTWLLSFACDFYPIKLYRPSKTIDLLLRQNFYMFQLNCLFMNLQALIVELLSPHDLPSSPQSVIMLTIQLLEFQLHYSRQEIRLKKRNSKDEGVERKLEQASPTTGRKHSVSEMSPPSTLIRSYANLIGANFA